MRRGQRLIAALLMLLFPAMAATAATAQGDELWRRLAEGGHIVLVRHALTEAGIGDPPGFRLDDCATQRNLSDVGKADARRLGEAFRSRGIPVSGVRSSRWCRCLDTARLAFGKADPDRMLDSMFGESEQAGRPKLAAVRKAIAAHAGPGNLILVTHNQNILALTGESVTSGEMVVVKPGPGSDGLRVLGRLSPGGF